MPLLDITKLRITVSQRYVMLLCRDAVLVCSSSCRLSCVHFCTDYNERLRLPYVTTFRVHNSLSILEESRLINNYTYKDLEGKEVVYCPQIVHSKVQKVLQDLTNSGLSLTGDVISTEVHKQL